jgi:hypothetical protein
MAGSKPGERRGGRKPGAPNKKTEAARLAFQMVYEERLDDLNRWLKETGDGFEAIHFLSDGTECKYIERNPAKAAELLLRMAEHFVPKLQHVEMTGKDGEKLNVNVSISGIVTPDLAEPRKAF